MFLGNVVSANGFEVDPDKVAAVVNLHTPTNVHKLRVFLGMVNHLRKFAKHLADKTKPIRDPIQIRSHWFLFSPPVPWMKSLLEFSGSELCASCVFILKR